MRITIEIDSHKLRQIQKLTGEKKNSAAISRALADFLRMRRRQELIDRALAGETDYALTNDALEVLDA
jgi:putative antitoxin of VapBC-like toxin-antitoxin system